MATRLKSLGLFFIGATSLQCTMANTVMLGANLNDTPALTIQYTGLTDSTVAGFYIAEGYKSDNLDCSDSALLPVDPYYNNFVVAPIDVSTSSPTTSIGQQALYNTIATTYQAYASSSVLKGIPDTFSIKISAIKTISYTSTPSYTASPLKDSGGITTQCYQVTCNSLTRTCTTDPATGYYS